MPTYDGTGESPTASANASQNLDVSKLTPEQLESHPHVQELKKKYSAAHGKMDTTNLTNKQLLAELAKYKTLAGEEDVPEEEVKPSYVTKEELQSTAWEIANAKDLEIYGDEQYQQELSEGIPKATALRYAKLRYEKEPNNAQVTRQQSMASAGSTSTRDLTNVEITDEDRIDMKRWGYSEKSLLRQKQLKKTRGQ